MWLVSFEYVFKNYSVFEIVLLTIDGFWWAFRVESAHDARDSNVAISYEVYFHTSAHLGNRTGIICIVHQVVPS